MSNIARHPRRRNRINEQFSARVIPMLESPAFRVLSRGAHQFLARLELELAHHGGNDSAKLPLTYQDLIDYGMTRPQIPPAMREAIALGFAECTRHGRAGNADNRTPSLWRLTYAHPRDGVERTHDWKRIKTMEQAKAVARDARAAKDPQAVRFGKNRNQYRKPAPKPVLVSYTETRTFPVQETNTTGSVRKPTPLSKSWEGGRVVVEARLPSKQRRVRLRS
jgi:hypothetical protein